MEQILHIKYEEFGTFKDQVQRLEFRLIFQASLGVKKLRHFLGKLLSS